MKLLKRLFFVYLAIAALLAVLVWSLRDLTDPLLPLRVTVVNEAGIDISSIETGIVSGDSKQMSRGISSGERAEIKPNLKLTGEGAIYQKYVFSDGSTKEAVVCGYTESISGKSSVTLHSDGRIEVEQKCY